MKYFSSCAEIAAPPAAAWQLLANVRGWPRWLSTVDAVEALDGDELRPGARYHIRQPRLRPATWTVTALVPLESFTWETRSPGVRMRAEHAITTRGPSACSVTLRFGFGGALGWLLAAAYGATARRYLEAEAAALKQVSERSPRAAAN